MHTQLEYISLLYQDVQTEYERQIECIKGKFEEVKEILERKERELVEDVEGRFRPLTSKLLGFVEELGKGLKANREKIEGLEGVRRMQEEEKVIRFQPVQVHIHITHSDPCLPTPPYPPLPHPQSASSLPQPHTSIRPHPLPESGWKSLVPVFPSKYKCLGVCYIPCVLDIVPG